MVIIPDKWIIRRWREKVVSTENSIAKDQIINPQRPTEAHNQPLVVGSTANPNSVERRRFLTAGSFFYWRSIAALEQQGMRPISLAQQ